MTDTPPTPNIHTVVIVFIIAIACCVCTLNMQGCYEYRVSDAQALGYAQGELQALRASQTNDDDC